MDALQIRSYTPADAATVMEIFNRAGADPGGRRATIKSLRAELAGPGGEARTDALVALWDGRPVGCAWMRRMEAEDEELFLTWGAVLPEYQRRGIGTALMKRLIAVATARRNSVGTPSFVGMLTSPRRQGSHELAVSLGCRRLTGALWLVRSTGDLPRLCLPEGFRLRRFVPGRDDEPYVELFNRSFADHFPRNRFTVEKLRGRLEAGLMEAAGIILAELKPRAGGGPGVAGGLGGAVGLCTGTFHRRCGPDGHSLGEIGTLGVLPEFRSRGLGRALLVHGLTRLMNLGAARAGLRVSEGNHTALALYDSLGFVEAEREIIWRLELA